MNNRKREKRQREVSSYLSEQDQIDRWMNEQKRREKEGERDQFMREMGIEVSDRKTGTRWIENSKNG